MEDIEEELIVQCSELLPGLLAQRAETGGESEEAAAKRKEREEKQAKEAAEKREKERAEKKAAKEKEAAEKKAAKEKQEEEKRQQKEAAAAEKEKRDKEKAEEKAKKDAEKAKKDEEKAKRDVEKAKQKEEEDKKKAEEKAAKEEEAAKKREEAAKKKEEEDKKKAEEKAKKDEEAAKKREEAAKKKEEEDKNKAEEKAKKDEEEKKKREEKEKAAAEKKRKEDKKAAAKEKEEDEKMKNAPEDEKKKYEEKKKAEKERKQKAEAEAKQKEEERKKKEEEKEAAAVKREEERKKKEEEEAKKAAAKEAEDKKKAEQKAIDDEKKAQEKEKAKKQKEEDDKKKAEEKAKKEIEDKKKREEAAKKKEEDDKKKAEEKAKKEEENKKKKEAAAKEKEERDKKKAEEKAAQDAKDKKRKEEEDKRKAEQKRKDDERKQKDKELDEQRKKKEQERKEKEKERAAKRKEEEDKRKEEQKQRKRDEDQKKEKEKRDKEKQEQKEKKEEKQQKKKEKKKKKQMGDGSSDEEWDEETGTMRKKINPINSRSAIQDGCCNESCAGCCRGLSIIFYIMFIPLIFAGLCFYEYNTYGFARVLDRSMGKDPDCWPDGPPPEGQMLQIPGCDDDGKEGVEFEALQRFLLAKEPAAAAAAAKAAPKAELAPKPPPKAGPKGAAGAAGNADEEGIDYAAIAAEFAEANPYCWIMPLIGLVMGIFSNIMPISGGLILMPLFEELEITKSSEETLALACMAQFVNSGVLGMFSWCGRDARLFICRALCMLIPIGWLGYAVGVTNNLSFKDMLIAIYKEVDDDSFLEDLNEADISLLHTYMRLGFGVFMMFMSFLVMFGCCIGGMNRCCCPSNTGGTTPGCKSFCQWIIVWALTFNTGYIFVANIGVGMGMTTFFLLSIFLGVEHKRAAPTAIVCGAWVSLAPALANWVILEASPYIRLMMMVPGMWFGALLAPWFSYCGGPMCDLVLFFLALVVSGTAVTAYAAMQIDKDSEDVNIDVKPVIVNEFIDMWFEKRRSGAA